MDINYISHKDIDAHKWDSCIHYSRGNAYAYTWYLNNICEEWDALVEGDYISVFPLVFNTQILSYKQIYNPPFAQQLGLFSVKPLSEKRMQAFLTAIPNEFKKITTNLNARCQAPENQGFSVEMRPNYQLHLSKNYDEITAGYSKNMKRSIKKAYKSGLRPSNNVSPEKLVELFRKHQGKDIKGLNEKSYFTMLRIIYQAQHRGLGFINGINNNKGELIAACFFLASHGKLTYLFPSSTPEGRETCAMHFMIDLLIQANAPSHKILDFEGSSLPGVARFYQSFGAENHPYPVIHKNNLPLPIKWLLRYIKPLITKVSHLR